MSQSPNDVHQNDARMAELTATERHRLLAAERRRLAMDAVANRTAPVELADLAADVATREDGTDADDGAIDRVAATLHHVHLPKMADAGVVDYDDETNRVDPSGRSVDG